MLTRTLFLSALCAFSLNAEDYTASRLTPTIDGKLDDWAGKPTITMTEPNVDDLKVPLAALAWDDKFLYIAVRVTDKTIVNAETVERLQSADSLEVRLCQNENPRETFVRIVAAPNCAENKPALRISAHEIASKQSSVISAGTVSPDKAGTAWTVLRESDTTWTAEIAIPFSVLGGKGTAGRKLPFVLIVWDRDRSDINEWQEWHRRSESSNQKKPATDWPCIILGN